METRTILFYDGDCGLCSRVVRFILKNERNSELFFCSLQSDFASNFLKVYSIDSKNIDTIYLYKNGKMYYKSTAALRLVPYLKKRFSLLQVCYVFPKIFRDFWYDLIATNRKRFFKNVCELGKFDSNRFV